MPRGRTASPGVGIRLGRLPGLASGSRVQGGPLPAPRVSRSLSPRHRSKITSKPENRKGFRDPEVEGRSPLEGPILSKYGWGRRGQGRAGTRGSGRQWRRVLSSPQEGGSQPGWGQRPPLQLWAILGLGLPTREMGAVQHQLPRGTIRMIVFNASPDRGKPRGLARVAHRGDAQARDGGGPGGRSVRPLWQEKEKAEPGKPIW